jgi:hypothetical protein
LNTKPLINFYQSIIDKQSYLSDNSSPIPNLNNVDTNTLSSLGVNISDSESLSVNDISLQNINTSN